MLTTKKIDKPQIDQKIICDSIPDFDLQYQHRIIDKSLHYLESLDDLARFDKDESSFKESYPGFTEHMKKMYSERFTNSRYPNAYELYIKIRTSQPYCPYCNFRSRFPSQIDHYLPKSVFPTFALTVDNLVPICSDCNKKKRNIVQIEKSKRIIHPYYDEFANKAFDYIGCEIIEENPIGFKFYIQKSDAIDDEQFQRLQTHFNLLALDKLYKADFEADFVSYIEELKIILNESDIEDTKKALERKIKSLKLSKQAPWRYAGYNALFNSDWFFNTYLQKLKQENNVT